MGSRHLVESPWEEDPQRLVRERIWPIPDQ